MIDPDTVEVRASNGAKTNVNVGLLRSECARLQGDGGHCIEAWLTSAVGMLRTADIGQLRVQLAIERGVTFVFKHLSDSAPWYAPIFGSLKIECYKGAPEFRYPVNEWDGRVLNLSSADIGHSCIESTRAALGPLNIPTRLPPDGVGTMNSRFAASQALFVDEWASIAKRFENKLLIAIPATDTILYVGRNDEAAAKSLTERAFAVRGTVSDQYHQLTIDAYRWTPNGWETATSHYMADGIAHALRQTFPLANVSVIDAETISLSGVGEPRNLTLGGLGLLCPITSPTCDQARIDFIAKFVQPPSKVQSTSSSTQ
ncbi:MAG TPA: hypothetical protein VHT03_14835 [Rhizomicrobium sp.]|nr:hypothetical protein [Rhizomicrobium sp.]